MKMFDDIATKIFEEADVKPSEAPELFQDAVTILNSQMARLSATMGLSNERVEIFSEQQVALVEDLRELKATGGLR